MINLLPTEAWHYSVLDVFRGFLTAAERNRARLEICLPGLGIGVPIRSARAALIVALDSLQLPPGSGIGVPLYCCPVVFKAIKSAGHRPVFLDIIPSTYCLSLDDLRAKLQRLDAIVAVHMFGKICAMPEILDIMKGRPVIEDSAQSLGSHHEGQMSGSFGDVSFFSFRSGKYLCVGEGGALYSARPALMARIRRLVESLPAPSRVAEAKHVLETYVRSKLRSRPLWGIIGAPIWSRYNRTTGFADKTPIVLGRMYRTDFAVVDRRMSRLKAMVAAQRGNADLCERLLRLPSSEYSEVIRGTFENRYVFPILMPSEKICGLFSELLRDRGIGTARPYLDVIQGARHLYGYQGDCPAAEQALRRTLIIPTHWRIRPKSMMHAIRLANEAWMYGSESSGVADLVRRRS